MVAVKAGSFLDGCKVYLSGFSDPEKVQLTRVLKYSGGVRLTRLVESVTHCVGNQQVAGSVGPVPPHGLSTPSPLQLKQLTTSSPLPPTWKLAHFQTDFVCVECKSFFVRKVHLFIVVRFGYSLYKNKCSLGIFILSPLHTLESYCLPSFYNKLFL